MSSPEGDIHRKSSSRVDMHAITSLLAHELRGYPGMLLQILLFLYRECVRRLGRNRGRDAPRF